MLNNPTPAPAKDYTKPGATGTVTPPAGADPAQQTAAAQVRAYLIDLGFPPSTADALSAWAWTEIVNGKSFDEIALDITQQPAFKAEFPEMELRASAGLPPMSAAEILQYRRQASELARQAGLPSGFYDSKDDFTRLIAGGVSLSEFADRVKAAQTAAYRIPADVREAFSDTLGIADFTALAFDSSVAVPMLEKRISEAEAVAAARRAGYGPLSAAERGMVADQGMTFEQQQNAFAELTNSQELFSALDGGETAIGRGEQLGAAFGGNAGALRRIQDRAAKRKATFQGSAGFGSSQEGVSGLGSSD